MAGTTRHLIVDYYVFFFFHFTTIQPIIIYIIIEIWLEKMNIYCNKKERIRERKRGRRRLMEMRPSNRRFSSPPSKSKRGLWTLVYPFQLLRSFFFYFFFLHHIAHIFIRIHTTKCTRLIILSWCPYFQDGKIIYCKIHTHLFQHKS